MGADLYRSIFLERVPKGRIRTDADLFLGVRVWERAKSWKGRRTVVSFFEMPPVLSNSIILPRILGKFLKFPEKSTVGSDNLEVVRADTDLPKMGKIQTEGTGAF